MTIFNFNMLVFMAMVVASTSFHSTAEPTKHVVGDDDGWNIPRYPEFYAEWVSLHKFIVGDSLYFNFDGETHDVAEGLQEVYDECKTKDASVIIKTGPGTINLTTEGQHHYISTINDDCKLHQKLAIYVYPSSP